MATQLHCVSSGLLGLAWLGLALFMHKTRLLHIPISCRFIPFHALFCAAARRVKCRHKTSTKPPQNLHLNTRSDFFSQHFEQEIKQVGSPSLLATKAPFAQSRRFVESDLGLESLLSARPFSGRIGEKWRFGPHNCAGRGPPRLPAFKCAAHPVKSFFADLWAPNQRVGQRWAVARP